MNATKICRSGIFPHESGFPQAIVGYCNFLQEDERDVRRRHSAHLNVRGMRMQLHWHENLQYRFAPALGLME
jgi:hypothetical protein